MTLGDEEPPVETELDLADRYSPLIRYDDNEPFFPLRVGYTILRRSGEASPSFPRAVNFATPETTAVIEYALYWDWDIQHLYELEHVWTHVGAGGEVTFVEASAHGGYRAMWPVEEMVGGTHPVLYSEPGKHAFSRDASPYTPEHQARYTASAWDKAGSMGLLVTKIFEGKIIKQSGDDALVQAHLKKCAFKPAFIFERREPIARELLSPWPEVFEWIPRRVQAVRDELSAAR